MPGLRPLLVVVALVALAGCDEERRAWRRAEAERRAQPLDPGLPPLELARELRRRADPEPLAGGALRRFELGELVRPSPPVHERGEAGITAALEGFSAGVDRSRLPELEAGSIREHLRRAILLNTSRMGFYAQLAGPLRTRSLLLSRYMVLGESVSLPNAGRWDRRSRALEEHGLRPLHGDLMPLLPLPRETPPAWRGVADAGQRRRVRALTDRLERELRRALDAGELLRVAELCHAACRQLIAWEQAWQMHWHMTRHTIGSIGLAALRGADQAHDPARKALSIEYLRGLVRHTIGYGRQVDRLAQPLQAQGSGIVVNEFTDQPFLQAWERERAGRPTGP